MKIAYLGIKGLPSKWGADRVVEALVNNLSAQDKLTVYCSARHVVETIPQLPNLNFIRIKPFGGKRFQMVWVDFFSALHAIFQGDYDIIHLHNIEASFILPLLRIKYPVISTSHGRMTSGNRWGKISTLLIQLMEIPFVWISNIATSVSKIDSSDLSKKYHRQVRYIPNGVDENPEVDILKAKRLLLEKGLKDKKFILFSAGRLIPLKGVHILLEAFNAINTDKKLVIIGDFSSSIEYYEQLKTLADNRVVFVPFVSSSATLFGIIKLSELFVFPSLQEAMSMTLLEATSLGVPIICSDIPQNKAVLEDCGYYFHSGDSEDLKEKIEWALQNTIAMKAQAKVAQDHVIKHFSWREIVKMYELIYIEALTRQRRNAFRA